MTHDNIRKAAIELSKQLMDRGKIIEGGWVGFQLLVIPPNAPEIQKTEMRKAFFAGCLHLFDSIMCVLDAGDEPTEQDMKRMELIQAELDVYKKEVTSGT